MRTTGDTLTVPVESARPEVSALPDLASTPDTSVPADVPAVLDVSSAVDAGLPQDGPPQNLVPAFDGSTPRVAAGAEVVAWSQPSPGALAVDGESIYWVGFGTAHYLPSHSAWFEDTRLMRCPKRGCADGLAALVTGRRLSGHGDRLTLVIDGGYVYWSDDGDVQPTDAARPPSGLQRCSIGDCSGTFQATGMYSSPAIAIADGELYVPAGSRVRWCPASGCASPLDELWTAVETTTPGSGSNDPNAVVGELAVDGSDVYWTATTMIMKCARRGCNKQPAILVPRNDTFSGFTTIALDRDNVYFDQRQPEPGNASSILACKKAGCEGRPTLLASGIKTVRHLASDGIHVYWVEWEYDADIRSNYSALRRCPVSGGDGTITTIASHLTGPVALALDDDHVYWTDDGGSETESHGHIWRALK